MTVTNSKAKILTANHLLLGKVVYLDQDDEWSLDIAQARVFESQEQAEARLVRADKQQDVIIGAYLVDVEVEENNFPQPSHFRELIRAYGPSSYIGNSSRI